jgi:POT family proton-dependent oligopeptide transporter
VATTNHDTAFFGHPRGLSTLFFTEMWERFTFYGMRAILVLFMTAEVAKGGLGFATAKAGAIYGTYMAMVYLMALPGGWIADRILGLRRSVLVGGIIIMLGNISLAIPGSLAGFYLGLLCMVIGTGLLKPSVSAQVGQLYSEVDTRRDGGFSIYYMGINLGALLSPLVVGWLAQSETFRGMLSGWGITPETSWHWGFGTAAAGMFLGLVQYVAGDKYLAEAGRTALGAGSAAEQAATRRTFGLGVAAVLAVGVVLGLLIRAGVFEFTAEVVSTVFGVVLLVIVIGFFTWLFRAGDWTTDERKRLIVIAVLFLGAAVFWSVFEQAGSTLTLFADRSTRTSILGFHYPSSWFQSVNSFFIIALAPVFAALWMYLGTRNPSSPTKFSVGLLFVALGFAVMIGASLAAQGGVQVSPMWLVLTYLLHTIGELCLSPVGLSAMTRLAPARVAGMMMGVWFLATSVGNYIGGRVAGLYESFSLPAIFGAVTGYALLAALVMALLIGPIKRMLARAE